MHGFSISEDRVDGPVRLAYQADGDGSSRDEHLLPTLRPVSLISSTRPHHRHKVGSFLQPYPHGRRAAGVADIVVADPHAVEAGIKCSVSNICQTYGAERPDCEPSRRAAENRESPAFIGIRHHQPVPAEQAKSGP